MEGLFTPSSTAAKVITKSSGNFVLVGRWVLAITNKDLMMCLVLRYFILMGKISDKY